MRDWTDRFLAKIDDAEGGCWQWNAHRQTNGYAQFKISGRVRLAHRVAYETLRGPIPDGAVIDHLCRNRSCVNPAHLEPVTQQTNVLRGVGIAARRARQTHCVHGHPFTASNTYVAPGGNRRCRTCRRAQNRRRGVNCAPA